MTCIKLTQITKLVDTFEQMITECINAQVISPADGAILGESANCLEEGYHEWQLVPSSLALAVRALSHVLGELLVHKELGLGPWSARNSSGMRSLERAEDGARRSERAFQSASDEESGAFSHHMCWDIPRRLH